MLQVTTNNFTFLKYPCIQNSPQFQFDKLGMAFFPLWMKWPIQIFSVQQVICLPDCKHSPRQLFRENWQIWPPNTWHLHFLFFCPKDSWENKRSAFELNERGQVSEGAISWGGFIKTSFMAFLLPAGGGEDRGKEFIPFADPLIL